MTTRMAPIHHIFKAFPLTLSLCFLAFFVSPLAAEPRFKGPEGHLLLKTGEKLPINLAVTPDERRAGLSGLKDDDFPDDRGLLFYYFKSREKFFWMPDTYFNLDIVFLNEDFKVIAIERNVPAHPGWVEPPEIARTRSIFSRHVLEIKAASKWSKLIKEGDQLHLDWDALAEETRNKIQETKKGTIKRIELKRSAH